MKRRTLWAGAMAAGILSLAGLGCPKSPATESDSGGTGTSPNANGAAHSGSGKKIAVIPKGTANSFWLSVLDGANAAGKEDGVTIIWQGPAKENDITEQVNVVRSQVNNHVDGIVLAACDKEALVQPVKDAMAKSIPVVAIDSGLTDMNAPLCFIATDNVKGGAAAADALAKAIGDKGNVGLMPFLKGAASSDEREKGFLDEMAKHPNIHVVATLYTDSDVLKAGDQTQNLLTSHPDIVGIFAANEPNGIGAANVLRQRKLAGKVKLVAFDGSIDEVNAIKDGTMLATIVQDPFQMGYKGVKAVEKAIRKEPFSAADKKIDSGFKVVTRDNMSDPEVAKLLPKK